MKHCDESDRSFTGFSNGADREVARHLRAAIAADLAHLHVEPVATSRCRAHSDGRQQRQPVAPIEAFPEERWDAVIATNLSSAFHATKAALPHMRARNWGRIINIASAHGLVASVDKSAYVASKHGVIGLTKVTALETATTGITANAIAPGWVLTPLVQRQIETLADREKISGADAKDRLVGEKQPSREFVTTEQIGAIAAFLCSDAAAQIRGATMSVDGGWTAQ